MIVKPKIVYKKGSLGDLGMIICKYTLDYPNLEAFFTTPHTIYVHNTGIYGNPESVLSKHKERGFAGIGYHFCIDPEGAIFYTRPLNWIGAHVKRLNRSSIGVAFLDMTQCKQSEKARKSFLNLKKTLEEMYGYDLEIKSHTEGQLSYINQAILQINREHGTSFEPINDERVNDPLVFSLMSEKLKTTADHMRRNLSPGSGLESFVKELKNCPGISYFYLFKTHSKPDELAFEGIRK